MRVREVSRLLPCPIVRILARRGWSRHDLTVAPDNRRSRARGLTGSTEQSQAQNALRRSATRSASDAISGRTPVVIGRRRAVIARSAGALNLCHPSR